MPLVGWNYPKGASGLHWFDPRAGVRRSACGRYPEQLGYDVPKNVKRRCWECAMNRCPTRDHPLGTCPGDHGK